MQPPPKGTASIQESCVDEIVRFLSGTQDSGEEHTAGREQAARLTGRGEFPAQEGAGGWLMLLSHVNLCFRPSPDHFDIAILCEPAPAQPKGDLLSKRQPQPPRPLGDKLCCEHVAPFSPSRKPPAAVCVATGSAARTGFPLPLLFAAFRVNGAAGFTACLSRSDAVITLVVLPRCVQKWKPVSSRQYGGR